MLYTHNRAPLPSLPPSLRPSLPPSLPPFPEEKRAKMARLVLLLALLALAAAQAAAFVSSAQPALKQGRAREVLLRTRGGNSLPAPIASKVAVGSVGVKAPPDMYENAVAAGTAKAAMTPVKTLVLGVLSGCHIGFGALLMILIGGNCPGIAAANPGLQKILMGAFGLPFGLFMTVVGGGELFTGSVALVGAAKMAGKVSPKQLLKNWSLAFTGNFIGSLMLVSLVVKVSTAQYVHLLLARAALLPEAALLTALHVPTRAAARK